MRLTEFDKDARVNVAKKYDLDEEQLDEILPALLPIAGRMAAGAAARGLIKGGIGAAKLAGRGIKKLTGFGAKDEKKVKQAVDTAKQKLIKPGQSLPMPSQDGKKETPHKITRVTGDEVEIEVPDSKPGQPNKQVYKKQDLEPIVKRMISQ